MLADDQAASLPETDRNDQHHPTLRFVKGPEAVSRLYCSGQGPDSGQTICSTARGWKLVLRDPVMRGSSQDVRAVEAFPDRSEIRGSQFIQTTNAIQQLFEFLRPVRGDALFEQVT